MPRYKITRKELKQPSEFQSLAENVQEFLLGNLRQVIISAVIVLAAAAAAFGMYTYERARDRRAGDAFYGALTALSAKQYQTAEAQFASLATAEPGRRIGKLARLYLAQSYQGEGDLAKARAALISFVANYHDPEFSSLALMDLGVVYERMGDLRKAQGAYQQAASVPGPEQLRAAVAIARMLSEQGDNAGAIQAYRAFLILRPYAQQRGEVLESLAMLGAGPADSQEQTLAAPAGSMPVVIPSAAASASATH
ncbi:MAG TPA: tetratricopeptide repeat protein [Candidatus Binataceae bacterium]|nr:tetratricopeptide repeat protein [Candidatus Binataceae bacterium]